MTTAKFRVLEIVGLVAVIMFVGLLVSAMFAPGGPQVVP